jgi:hypothetical protein
MNALERAMALYEATTPFEVRLAWMLNNEAECDERRQKNPPQPLTPEQLADLDERCRDFFGDD